MLSKILVVMIGCAFGGGFRFLINTYANKWIDFPCGTLIANIVGCFLIGIITTLLTEYYKGVSTYIALFLTVGFLGGLTTFSSFANETMIFFRAGDIFSAVLNVCLNTIGGLIAVLSGMMIVRFLY